MKPKTKNGSEKIERNQKVIPEPKEGQEDSGGVMTGQCEDISVCRGRPGVPCGNEVGQEDKGVECDICQNWYHASCQDVSSKAYSALQEHAETLAWICKECKLKIGDKNVNLSASIIIENKLDALAKAIQDQQRVSKKSENKIDTLAEVIQDQERVFKKSIEEHDKVIRELGEFQGRNVGILHEQNEEILGKISTISGSSIKEIVGKTYADVAKRTSENIISTIGKKLDTLPKAETIADMELKVSKDIKKVIESKEKEDRSVNILVHNVTESKKEDEDERRSEDLKQFYEISEALGCTNIEVKKVVRLRRRMAAEDKESQVPRPRIMLLKLNSSDHVDLLYRRRFNLKSKGYTNIYITRDLPPQEREAQRKLREELQQKGKDTHIIFRGRVVEMKERR